MSFSLQNDFMYDGNYHFRNFCSISDSFVPELWGGGLCGFFWLPLTAFVFPQKHSQTLLTTWLWNFICFLFHPASFPIEKLYPKKGIGQTQPTYTPTVAQLLYFLLSHLFIWLQIDFFIWLSIFALKSSSIRSCRREMLSLISFMLNPKWMCIILCTKKRKKQTWWDICVDMETEFSVFKVEQLVESRTVLIKTFFLLSSWWLRLFFREKDNEELGHRSWLNYFIDFLMKRSFMWLRIGFNRQCHRGAFNIQRKREVLSEDLQRFGGNFQINAGQEYSKVWKSVKNLSI